MTKNETSGSCVAAEVGRRSDGYRYYFMCYTVFISLLMPISLVMFLKLRRRSSYLRVRSFPMLLLLSFGVFCDVTSGAITRVSNDENSLLNNCVLSNFPGFLIIPCMLLAAVIRILLFLNRYHYNKRLSDTFKAANFSRGRNLRSDSFQELHKMKTHSEEYFGAKIAVFAIIILAAISAVITAQTCPEFGKSENCIVPLFTDNLTLGFLFFALGVIAVFFFCYTFYKVKDYPDPFGILSEVRTALALGFIFILPPGLVLMLLNSKFEEKTPHRFDTYIIYQWGLLVVFCYSVPYQLYIGTKSRNEQATLFALALNDVLENDIGRSLFRQHLVNEFSVENLNFIESVDAYHELFGEDLNEQLIAFRAEQIMNSFVLPKAETRLNISFQASANVQERFAAGEYSRHMFQPAYREVFSLLSNDSFSRFRVTEEFKRFVGADQT